MSSHKVRPFWLLFAQIIRQRWVHFHVALSHQFSLSFSLSHQLFLPLLSLVMNTRIDIYTWPDLYVWGLMHILTLLVFVISSQGISKSPENCIVCLLCIFVLCKHDSSSWVLYKCWPLGRKWPVFQEQIIFYALRSIQLREV